MGTNDRIEFFPGDRYYKVIIDGYVIALCPNDVTAKMCYFALTTYKNNIADLAKQLKEKKETNAKQ